MIRATYVRTLKPGVTDEQFIAAWMPPGQTVDTYPARVTISHGLADERQIISTFELDIPAERLADALPTLVHPDSTRRLAEIVESTQLEAVFEDTGVFGEADPQIRPV
nr:hypothetical protein [Kibdelosporangium sp. MJ126-NF4]CEL18365.1 hypothetical protein [Kibdelosporangium sp. MJ126-NF4]CTQ97850.1 hypothetical protein [Kibdelosporangium sp. MJ126-NF4]